MEENKNWDIKKIYKKLKNEKGKEYYLKEINAYYILVIFYLIIL